MTAVEGWWVPGLPLECGGQAGLYTWIAGVPAPLPEDSEVPILEGEPQKPSSEPWSPAGGKIPKEGWLTFSLGKGALYKYSRPSRYWSTLFLGTLEQLWRVLCYN